MINVKRGTEASCGKELMSKKTDETVNPCHHSFEKADIPPKSKFGVLHF